MTWGRYESVRERDSTGVGVGVGKRESREISDWMYGRARGEVEEER